MLLVAGGTAGRAQLGLHPPRVDFQQLTTDHARILFPKGYETRARRVAALIDNLQANHTRSVGERIYDIDLVLQTTTTEINGYVGLGPFRSEFYTTPPQSMNLLSNTDWVDLLTIHEYRHVQQASNERRGITRLFSWLQGQEAWAALSFLATPNWFSEGDAVIYETALSPGGRGRTPAFSSGLRSLLHEDIVYPYAKARNGSLRDLVPDHYRYGYAMLTYARERFGNDVWRSVLHDGAAYKGIFYPFSRALRKKTGLGTRALYRTTMADLAARQDSAVAARGPLVAGQPLGRDARDVRVYRFPTPDDRGRVLALRSGYRMTPDLVAVDPAGGRDERITAVGIQREPYVHVRGNLAVWHEDRQHPRYTNERYSEIVLYQLDGGYRTVLTEGGKYFAPALSFDRRTIVAVEHDPLAGPPAVVTLASNTGAVTGRYPMPDATAVSFPCFSPDGETIYYYHRDFGGAALRALSVATGASRTVRPRSHEPLDNLQVTAAGTLVFSNGRDGVDNIYELDPATGGERQLTHVAVGAEYPHLTADGTLYYAAPTPRGSRLRRLNVAARPAGKDAPRPAGPNFFERPAAFVAETKDLSGEPTGAKATADYEIRDFGDKLGGIRLHSWSFNGNYVRPGATVAATNALNTVAIAAGLSYNFQEERTTVSAGVDYGGWYPVVSLAANTGGRAYNTLATRTDTVIVRRSDFNQQSLSLGARVPLRWVAGDYRSSLTPSVTASYLTTRQEDAEPGDLLPAGFTDLALGLTAAVLRRQARQQVQPRLGLTLTAQYNQGLGDEADGRRFLWRSSLYLPGLARTHGLRLDFDAQTQDINNAYQYANAFLYPRGYGVLLNDRITRVGVNYQLPLLYPDFGLFGITYFQRVRLNAFYDYGRRAVTQFDFTDTVSSAGGQVFFDNVWLNAAPLPVGVEVAYLFSPVGEGGSVRFRLLVTGSF